MFKKHHNICICSRYFYEIYTGSDFAPIIPPCSILDLGYNDVIHTVYAVNKESEQKRVNGNE